MFFEPKETFNIWHQEFILSEFKRSEHVSFVQEPIQEPFQEPFQERFQEPFQEERFHKKDTDVKHFLLELTWAEQVSKAFKASLVPTNADIKL